MTGDDSSDLSSVPSLSPPPVDDDSDVQLKKEGGILKFFHKVPKLPPAAPKEMSPPLPKRAPSPPHEYVLADNENIAFIVMFRAKFADALPKNLPTFGPKELEGEVVDSVPGDRIEQFLCAVLKLLHNRQQDVKPGHYNRALEDAIKNHESSWPRSWEGASPLLGGATFASMSPVQRLELLRYLILWTMSSSKVVKDKIDSSYKGKRTDDDSNMPLSVQPLGSDSDKRRYFLIEGPDNTSFRIYRESNPAGFQRTWWSVAGSIEELHTLTDKLLTGDGGPKAKKLSQKLLDLVPHFEESLEKLRRREYRLARKQQFKRPEPGFSMYEGRTRGKRVKYNYDDDDDDFLTDSTNRRSARNTGTHTPAEPAGPVVTASGRQVRAPHRLTVETLSNDGGTSAANSVHGDGDSEMKDDVAGPRGRPRRSAAANHSMNGWSAAPRRKKADDDYDSDEEDGSEPDFGDDEEEDDHVPDESDEEIEEEFEDDEMGDDEEVESPGSLVIKLPVKVALNRNTGQWAKTEGGPAGAADRSSEGGTPTKAASPSRSSPHSPEQTPEQTEDVIAVAVPVKQLAAADPEPVSEPSTASMDPKLSSAPSGGGTNGLPTTALAFRGSPEKPQSAPRPIDV